jgi:hypothetical protein
MKFLEPRTHLVATIAIRCVAFDEADDEIAGFVDAVVGGGALVLLCVGAQHVLRDQGEF